MKYKFILILILIFIFAPLGIKAILRLPNDSLSLTMFRADCLAEEWKELRSVHFVIYYKRASRDFLYKLRRTAEDYYKDILDELGFRRSEFWTWENRAMIYLFDSSQEYIEETKMASWSAANVDYRNKIIRTYPNAPNLLENVLAHELAHIIFREYVGFGSNVPLWLDEGVAMFMEKKRDANLFKRELQALEQDNVLSSLKELTTINKATSFAEDKAKIFYIQSFNIVYFLIKQFGKDAFSRFCYLLKQGKSLEKSLWLTYYIRGLDDLETKWRSYFFD